MQTYLLSVDTALLNLANVKRAEFRIKRAIVADSFIIVPDFKKIVTVTSQSFTVELLRNTPGSIYEVIMYDDKSQVLGAFFDMPEDAANLHELELNTSYPIAGAGGCCAFVDLIGSPGQFAGNGGKVLAVKQNETGLEYIECNCNCDCGEGGCQTSAPHTISFDNTIFAVDSDKTYKLYFRNQDGEILSTPVNQDGVDNQFGNNKFISLARLPAPNGMGFSLSNNDESIPEYCNSFEYVSNCYLTQNVGSWVSGNSVGNAFVAVDGVTYNEADEGLGLNHSFGFSSAVELKAVLAPYYTGIATFLQNHGVNAEYDADIWGSYNTGGIRIIRTQAELSTITIGSESGQDLSLGINEEASTCVGVIPFAELPNGPNTLTITPFADGTPAPNTYTLLANYSPMDGSINVLAHIGVTEDIVINTCFEVQA